LEALKTDYVIVLCTAPPEEAVKLAKILVEERLAACVNLARVRSYFFWESEVCNENEDLLIIKTKRRKLDDLTAKIREIHSYEVPEIISIPIMDGDERYLEWIATSLKDDT